MSIIASISRASSPRTFSEWPCRHVDQHIQLPEGRDGLFDSALDSFDVGSVRCIAIAFPPSSSIALTTAESRAGVLHVSDGHGRSICGQALGDRSTDTGAPASDESDLPASPLPVCCHVFPFIICIAVKQKFRKTCSNIELYSATVLRSLHPE